MSFHPNPAPKNTSSEETSAPISKKPYVAPELKEHGTVEQLTQSVIGSGGLT